MPSKRTNGPAGTSRETVASPRSTWAVTALVPVLTARVKSPSTCRPGTWTAMLPLNRPASPVGVITRAPVPPVRVAPAVAVPRVRPTLVAAIRICLVAGVPGAAVAGAGVTTCSKAKVPVRDWPTTVSGAAVVNTTTTRTVPAAMVTAVGVVTVWLAPVVLRRTAVWTVTGVSVGAPRRRVAVASKAATTPPSRRVTVPEAIDTLTG